MTDIGVVNGKVTSRPRSNRNQAEAFLDCILEQEDTDAVLLLEDVDVSESSRVAFETWIRLKTDDCFRRVNHDWGEFDGADAVKEGHKDESRFVLFDNRRMFLVAVAWTVEHEVRTFSAYPELLVIDGKMNTNKSKLEYYIGVGVQGAWGNSVLFRAWLPNKTRHAYEWLWLHALPTLLSRALLHAILGVMSDDCSTMQPILVTLVCKPGGILPNAQAYLCIYHFQRIFFSKFGMGSSVRQWNLVGSKAGGRGGNWGGKVTWRYPWQRVLSGAMYRLQKSETKSEFQQCLQWIATVINTAPNLGPVRGDLRNAVRKVFQSKVNDKEKWAKLYRKIVRIYDANASSRGEGEFSHTWELGLTSQMTFRTGFVKIRFGSDRRMYRNIEKAESWMGTKLKRRNAPMYNASVPDWQFMCDKFTPHYHKKIESQVRAAHTFLTCALVEKSDTCVIWKVWSTSFDADLSESDSDSESDTGADRSNDVEHGPEVYTGEGGRASEECVDFPVVESATIEMRNDDDADGFESEVFKWRHVREVMARQVDGKWEFTCDCAFLQRTCVVCRHIFTVFWHVFGRWRISEIRWHRAVINVRFKQ